MTTPAPEWFLTDLDLRHNQLLNARAHNASSAPANPAKGQLWFDTDAGVLKYYDGSVWTGGRVFYNQVADDGANRAQRARLNFRSTAGIAATVIDDPTNFSSVVTADPVFGAVTPSVVAGAAAADGTSLTLARSDHSHGAPAGTGQDTVLTSWWQHDQQSWSQLTATANFVSDLPGQTVGGGWMMTAPGSIYWTGNPIPVAELGVYRNTARVSAPNVAAKLTMGWLCYDADGVLLGQVKCANEVPVDPASETGLLVSRNVLHNPSGEGPGYGSEFTHGWQSNDLSGTAAIAAVERGEDRASTGIYSVKATWPAFGGGQSQSNVLALSEVIPRGTQMTLGGRVYVPTGSPDVCLDVAYYASSVYTSVKDQWIYLEKQFTTAADEDKGYLCGMRTATSAPGAVAYLDDVVLREGWGPMPGGRIYFDGNVPSSSDQSFVWEGDPDNSPSLWYTLEPNWEIVTGYIAIGEGVEPAVGDFADVNEAVNPPPGTVYYRPFVACAGGTLIVDSHEVQRGQRDLTVLDGLHTGWVESTGPVSAPTLVTSEVMPPDTDPPSYVRVGPVVDPPVDPGDAIARAYLDRRLGLGVDEATGEVSSVPPQFLFSGEGGAEPAPADLGYLFSAWPLFSLWADTAIEQSRISVMTGSYSGNLAQPTPLVSAWTAVPGCYRVVTTPPADGVMIGVSNGVVNANYADYMLVRCAAWADVDGNGLGGTYIGLAGETACSSSGAGINRMGYTTFSIALVGAGQRYSFRTEYNHGGPTANVNRDRTFVIYLPGAVRKGAA